MPSEEHVSPGSAPARLRLAKVSEIAGWLEEVHELYEATLDQVALTNFGYAAVLAFTRIVNNDGKVLEQPAKAAFEFGAVHDLVYKGDLSQVMVDHPEEIGCGMSEVSAVNISEDENGVHFEVLWDHGSNTNERRVYLRCARASVTITDWDQ